MVNDNILTKITLPGSVFLAIVAILPAFAGIAGVSRQFSQFYGGTSLLIMVGVILDTLQQIESYLLMRHYEGLMKSGKLSFQQVLSVKAKIDREDLKSLIQIGFQCCQLFYRFRYCSCLALLI